MIPLDIKFQDMRDRKVSDVLWPDLPMETQECQLVSIGFLEQGTASGNTSVGLRIKTEDGKEHIAQTTLLLLKTAIDAAMARYGR